jgi:hypothetical protein
MSKRTENLNAVETKAVAALISAAVAKNAASQIPVGEHAVDLTLRITGTLTKGEDYESHKVEKADPWLLLAVALSHLNGMTVDSIVKEALTAAPELVESLKDRADEAIAKVKAPTLGRENGKVTVKIEAVRV